MASKKSLLKNNPAAMTGREASILALLAQCTHLNRASQKRIILGLKGPAAKIARALTGIDKRPSRKAAGAAEMLRIWANSLSKRPPTYRF